MKPITYKPLGPMNVDMTGEKYGFLTVLGYAGFDTRPSRCAAMWWCRCANCGKVKKIARTGLRFGRAKSCGKKGCKAQAKKLFPPSEHARRYNLTKNAKRSLMRAARRAALRLAKKQHAERMKAQAAVQQPEPAPTPAPLPFRRAIDTPERFQHPDLGKRGRNRQFIFSHPGNTHETKMPTPVVDPDTALWLQQVRA